MPYSSGCHTCAPVEANPLALWFDVDDGAGLVGAECEGVGCPDPLWPDDGGDEAGGVAGGDVGAEVTVWRRVAELAVHPASVGVYEAAIVLVPTGSSAVETCATPSPDVGAEPRVPKSTVPARQAAAADVTVAVNVTDWPCRDGLAEERSASDVGAGVR